MNKLDFDRDQIKLFDPTGNDLLGYYQREDKTYVLTFNHSDSITNIDKIAHLLNEAVFSDNFFSDKHNIKAFQYLDKVFVVIDKHNAKIDEIKKRKIYKLLSFIPLISSIIDRILRKIEKPNRLIDGYLQKKKIFIETLLTSSPDVKTLIQSKNELIESNSAFKKEINYAGLQGLNDEILKKEKSIINEIFEAELTKKSPALSLAHKIVNLTPLDPNKSYREILEFSEDLRPSVALEKYDAILYRALVVSGIEISENHASSVEEAKKRAAKAYEQWEVQRILTLEPFDLKKALAVEDRANFLQSYLTIVTRLKKIVNPGAATAITLLQQRYKDFLEPFVAKVCPEAFINLTTPSEISAKRREMLKVLNEYKAVTPFPTFDQSYESINRGYDKALCELIPLYAEAKAIVNEEAERKNSSTQLIVYTDLARVEKSLNHKLEILENGLFQLEPKELPDDILKEIKKAHTIILEKLQIIKEKQLDAKLKEEKRSKSLISHTVSFFSVGLLGNDKGTLQPLKLYKEKILKILEISDEKAIEQKYLQKLEELKKFPNSSDMKGTYENALLNYQRALIIQPFLAKTASWTSTITLEDIMPASDKADLIQIDEQIDSLIKHLELEKQIQTSKGNPLMVTIENTKSALQKLRETTFKKRYPKYLLVKSTLDHLSKPHFLYHSILKIDLKTSYSQALQKKIELEKMIEPSELDKIPLTLQNDTELAIKAINLAYKEWEADRIIALPSLASKDQIAGLSYQDSEINIQKRIKILMQLFHPDKNKDAPSNLLEKFTNAFNLLV